MTPYRRSSCDCLYLSYGILWTKGHAIFVPLRDFVLTFVIIPRSTRISLFHESLQLFFWYELFYLLLQVSAVFCVMPMIFVETAVFSLVMHVRRQVQWSRPFEVMFVLNLCQNLVNRHN